MSHKCEDCNVQIVKALKRCTVCQSLHNMRKEITNKYYKPKSKPKPQRSLQDFIEG